MEAKDGVHDVCASDELHFKGFPQDTPCLDEDAKALLGGQAQMAQIEVKNITICVQSLAGVWGEEAFC